MADKKLGLLVAGLNFARAAEDEFNDWYDSEHVPEREQCPGFINAQRWISIEDPKVSIATYDLKDSGVLKTPEYLSIGGPGLSPWSKRILKIVQRVCRYEGEQTLPGDGVAPANAGGLLLFAMNVAPEAEVDFNDWYNKEHVPNLATVPGCLSARRFVVNSGAPESPQKYVALYHLEKPEVCMSDEWKKAVDTPWTHRVRPHTRDRLRVLARRYSRKA